MALGASTISGFGGAVDSLFTSFGDKAKAQGDFAEAKNYGLAADLAGQNEKFTETSTAIKQAQIDRENTKMIGGQEADVAGAGFAASGSALDLLRESAQQGALHREVASEQGLITEAGYKEQQQSYLTMQKAAIDAGNAANDAATFADISAVFKGVTAIASIFTGMPDASAVMGQAANSAMGDPTGIGGLY